jgi:hypothetical protein
MHLGVMAEAGVRRITSAMHAGCVSGIVGAL